MVDDPHYHEDVAGAAVGSSLRDISGPNKEVGIGLRNMGELLKRGEPLGVLGPPRALAFGLPGRLKSIAALWWYAQRSNMRPENSLPLSTKIRTGAPRWAASRLHTSTTFSARNR